MIAAEVDCLNEQVDNICISSLVEYQPASGKRQQNINRETELNSELSILDQNYTTCSESRTIGPGR